MPLPRTVERMVEDQASRLLGRRLGEPGLAFHPVVTLSQLPGARGDDLARRLGQDLHYALFDREIIDEIANRAHVSEGVVRSLDERHPSALEESLFALLAAQPLSAHSYYEHLVHVIRAVGQRGSAVIVGRGAHLLLGSGEAIRVLVEAPRHARVARFAERDHVGAAEAARRLAAAETERRDFLRKYFRADVDDHGVFDLVVNTYALGVEGAAAAIEAALFTLAGPAR